jgi:magnesium chelatase subunit H
VKRARGGEEARVYISDRHAARARCARLQDQVALETRSRSLNPKWFEGLLKHGHEGVRQIEAQVTNTWAGRPPRAGRALGLSADFRDLRARCRDAGGWRSSTRRPRRMANRLLEAHDRNYWQPDEATLEALQDAADELEDRMEGIAAE